MKIYNTKIFCEKGEKKIQKYKSTDLVFVVYVDNDGVCNVCITTLLLCVYACM